MSELKFRQSMMDNEEEEPKKQKVHRHALTAVILGVAGTFLSFFSPHGIIFVIKILLLLGAVAFSCVTIQKSTEEMSCKWLTTGLVLLIVNVILLVAGLMYLG